MQLKDLRTFQAIADIGSLHGAADALGVTQSALSKSVRRLETALGVRLFERTARGVALTPVGKALYARNIGLAQLVDDIQAEIRDLRTGQAGRLRIGSVPALVDTVLSPAMAALHAAGSAGFDVHVQLSNELLRGLAAGKLDLALAAMNDYAVPELAGRVLGAQSSHVVVRAGHPLLARGFTLQDLAAGEWVLPGGDIALRIWVERLFAEQALGAPRVFIETDTSPVVFASLVRESDMLTVMTADSLCSPVAAGLVPLPAPAPAWELQMALFWRRGAYLSKAMRVCTQEIVRAFSQRGAAPSRSTRATPRR